MRSYLLVPDRENRSKRMSPSSADEQFQPGIVTIKAGCDRFEEHRWLGVSVINFKVTPQDSEGLLIVENVFHSKGGPAKHLHVEQDEWFHVTEGEFDFEGDGKEFTLGPGDSLLGPRKVPHVWAHVGEGRGRILIVFSPAGRMESFFREVTKANAMPPLDPALWLNHGMKFGII